MSSEWQESFGDRLIGVVRLNRPIYEAIKRDPRATAQALLIVIFLGLASGIAFTSISGQLSSLDTTGLDPQTVSIVNEVTETYTFESNGEKLTVLIGSVLVSLSSWIVSAWVLTVLGNRTSRNLGDAASRMEVRRLVGWGYAPQLAFFLTPIPVIGPLLASLGWIWALVTSVMSLRVAFRIGVGHAIAIAVVAVIVSFIVLIVAATVAATLIMLMF